MSPPPLLKKIASIREGNSCRVSARLIKISQAGVEVKKQESVGEVGGQSAFRVGPKTYHSRIQVLGLGHVRLH